MSTHRNRLCQLTGSFLLIAAESTTASAGLLGGLLGTSNEDSSSQTALAEDYSEKGRFSEPFAEPTIICLLYTSDAADE